MLSVFFFYDLTFNLDLIYEKSLIKRNINRLKV